MIESKICSKCGVEKKLGEFRNQKRGKFGKKGYCRPCDDKNAKENYLKNQEARIEQVKEWNEENPDKLKAYQEKWRKKQ